MYTHAYSRVKHMYIYMIYLCTYTIEYMYIHAYKHGNIYIESVPLYT